MQICHDTKEELLKAMQIYGVMLQQGRAQCRLLISFAPLVKDAFFCLLDKVGVCTNM